MFTGIVEDLVEIQEIIRSNKFCEFKICYPEFIEDISVGDSVLINGVCLTVTNIMNDNFFL